MATHAFNDGVDYTKGGTWYGDYGQLLCRWTWDSEKQELSVSRGSHGKRIEVGRLPLSREPLERRLPQLAFEAGERLARESSMAQFAVAHRTAGTTEAPTYYRIDGYGRTTRVGDANGATAWPTEDQARQAIQLGLANDPEVFVVKV